MNRQEIFEIERLEAAVRHVAAIGQRSRSVAQRGVKRMIQLSERTIHPFDHFYSEWRYRARHHAWGREERLRQWAARNGLLETTP